MFTTDKAITQSEQSFGPVARRSVGIARPRLFHELTTIADRRLGLVVAPAGSGKSTLIRQFAAALDCYKVCYQVTPSDVRSGAFSQNFGRAVWQSFSLSQSLSGDERGTAVVDPGPIEDVRSIANLLDDRLAGDDGFLVLDDLHLLESSDGIEAFAELLDLLPRSVRVLIGSRVEPGIDLNRLRLDDDLVMISGDDLRFRSWEIEELFKNEYQTWLPPRELGRLAHATDGWAAGLKLFHLATLNRTDAERAAELERLTSSRSHTVRDYLTRNVLSSLPNDVLSFLTTTSVLGHLSAATCDALLGHDVSNTVASPSAKMLEDLAQKQLFTEHKDRGVFRYHEVMRGHLESLLSEQLDPERLRALYMRAGEILESNQAPGEAVRAYICAGDLPSAIRALGDASVVPNNDDGWMRRLPSGLTGHDPWVQLLQARRMVSDGQPVAAFDAYQRLLTTSAASEAARIGGRDLRELRRWLDSELQPHDPTSWRSLLRSAFFKDPDSARLTSGYLPNRHAPVTVGVAALLDGQFPKAISTFQGLELSGSYGEIVSGARALAYWFSTGRNPAPILARIRDRADRNGLGWMSRIVRATLLAFPLPTDPSFEELISAISKPADDSGEQWSPAVGALFGGLGKAFNSNHPLSHCEAIALLEDATDRFEQLNAHVLASWAQLSKLALLLAVPQPLDDLEAALSRAHTITSQAKVRAVNQAISELQQLLDDAKAGRAEPILHVEGETDDSSPGRTDLYQFAASSAELMRAWFRRSLDEGHLTTAMASVSSTSSMSAAIRTTANVAVERHHDRDVTPLTKPGAANVSLARVFGEFSLVLNGTVVDIQALKPRARSVLRFLVLRNGRLTHRDELLDSLWPEVPVTSSTKSLHVCFSAIRHALGPHADMLRRNGEAYALDPVEDHDLARFTVKLDAAEERRRAKDIEGALTLLESAVDGPPLSLLPDEGHPDWLATERDQLVATIVRSCAAISKSALDSGQFAAAGRAAEAGLRYDRYYDDFWQTLQSALERSGRLAEAARAQHRYDEVLRELGLITNELPGFRGPRLDGLTLPRG